MTVHPSQHKEPRPIRPGLFLRAHLLDCKGLSRGLQPSECVVDPAPGLLTLVVSPGQITERYLKAAVTQPPLDCAGRFAPFVMHGRERSPEFMQPPPMADCCILTALSISRVTATTVQPGLERKLLQRSEHVPVWLALSSPWCN